MAVRADPAAAGRTVGSMGCKPPVLLLGTLVDAVGAAGDTAHWLVVWLYCAMHRANNRVSAQRRSCVRPPATRRG